MCQRIFQLCDGGGTSQIRFLTLHANALSVFIPLDESHCAHSQSNDMRLSDHSSFHFISKLADRFA